MGEGRASRRRPASIRLVPFALQQLPRGNNNVSISIGYDIHAKTLTLQTTFNRLRWFVTSEFASDGYLSMRHTSCFCRKSETAYLTSTELVLYREREIVRGTSFVLFKGKIIWCCEVY
jgi:hypothetical protein